MAFYVIPADGSFRTLRCYEYDKRMTTKHAAHAQCRSNLWFSLSHFFALFSFGMLAKPPSKCLTPLLKILGEQLRLQLSKHICTLYTSLSFLQVQQVLEDIDDFTGRISLLGALDSICLLGG